MALPGELQRRWDGLEENRGIILGRIGSLPAEAFIRTQR